LIDEKEGYNLCKCYESMPDPFYYMF